MPGDLHAIVMAGGSGVRFWPASRARLPKQFLPIAGDVPLLARTLARLRGLVPPERIWVCLGSAHRDAARESLAAFGGVRLLVEPFGCDTAACVAFSALAVSRVDPEARLAVLPADHVIDPEADFREALRAASTGLGEGELLTFGIRPREPATSYGYVEVGSEVGRRGMLAVHRVAAFREKPDLATAQGYLRGGKHLWNAGIFLWRAKGILAALRRYVPRVVEPLEAVAADFGTEREPASLAQAYARSQRISIDYGVLEPASRSGGARDGAVTVVPVDWTWDDVGSWGAAARYLAEDGAGNRVRGAVEALDSAGCIAVSDAKHLVALLGAKDLIVVHTPDATLVCDRAREGELKKLQEHLKARGREGVL
ncbi:MAG: mannose-1-phosphate guanylyltransferase [Planctomycetes bacterium]|nr:mannose-1-phosphate guanylyltransferase [Planctomycetota bacterium]